MWRTPLIIYIYQIRSRFTLNYITLPFKSNGIEERRVLRNNNQISTAATVLLFNPERFEYIYSRKIILYLFAKYERFDGMHNNCSVAVRILYEDITCSILCLHNSVPASITTNFQQETISCLIAITRS